MESSFKILPVNVALYSNSTNLTWIFFAKKRYKNRLIRLRITADRFSGIRAPEWIITDEEETRTRLKEIAKNGSIVAEFASAEAGLGFRGFTIEPLSDELAQDFELPASIWLPVRVPLALKRMRLLSV